MKNILLLGAGKIGIAITLLLRRTGEYRVTVADYSADALTRFTALGVDTVQLDINDSAALRKAMAGQYAVLNALPFHTTSTVAYGAYDAGIHYFDLTEDVASTRVVKEVAAKANSAFVPQCGLAPGFVSIAAHGLAAGFDSLRDVQLRVGALPRYPTNALKYNLTWSTDGLINEYLNPCEAVQDGRNVELPPLEDLEEFALEGVTYEAFNTSGGLGSLTETLAGKVENLTYKSVRYPGHCAIIKLLVEDLRLARRRDLLKEVLEEALPITMQDVVLVFCTVSGKRHGRLEQESIVRHIYGEEVEGHFLSAIQMSTAAGICAMLDLQAAGHLPAKGFVRQEQMPLDLFLSNRFGKVYA